MRAWFVLCVSLLLQLVVSQQSTPTPPAPPSCGCVARSQGWIIDCGQVATVGAALAYLETNACNAAKCRTDARCRQSFFVLNAHHDYCPDDALPTMIEEGVHAFETFCDQCAVLRRFDPAFPVCRSPTCSNLDSVVAAVAAMVAANCTADCSVGNCPANYRQLRAAHDLCAESDLPEAAENAIHVFEGPCQAHTCNAAVAPFDPNACATTASAAAPAGAVTSSGPSATAIAGVVLATIAIVLALALLGVVFVLFKRIGTSPAPYQQS